MAPYTQCRRWEALESHSMKPVLFIVAAAAGLTLPLGAPSASETNVAVGSQNVNYAGLNPWHNHIFEELYVSRSG